MATPLNLTLYSPSVGNRITEVLANTTAGVTHRLLPLGSGFIETVKDGTGLAGTNNITVTDINGVLIDGAASYVLSNNYESVDFYWNGSAWRIK